MITKGSFYSWVSPLLSDSVQKCIKSSF